MSENKSVIIAGAGLGGLATALRLAKRGYKVEILEKNNNAGGRVNQLVTDGFTFDTGPSFFSMSYEFDEFAKDCSIDMPFRYTSLDPLYTVSFSKDSRSYKLFKDPAQLAEQFRDVEPGFENKMRRYLDKCGRLYNDTNVVIKSNYDSLPGYLMTLAKVNPVHLPVIFRSFWQQVSVYFSSEEARQILSLVAFFLGRTPFDTSAVYTLLSYTEFVNNGYFNVEGGMYQIIEGIIKELEKANVSLKYNTEITSVEHDGKRITHLIDSNGKKWSADIYIINADAALFRGKVLGRKEFSEERLDRMEWTMGPLTMYLGIKGKLPEVEHHNYYLGSNFREYADKVYKNPGVLEKPYYYVNVLSRTNPSCAPEGCESLFFVCPVPDLRFKKDWSDKESIIDSIIADFSERIKRDIKPSIVTKTIYTPADWEKQYNLHRGSGLGLSHKMTQIGGFRPTNFDEVFKNLFYVGASTIPGTGLPMVIISSRLAVERVVRYSDSAK